VVALNDSGETPRTALERAARGVAIARFQTGVHFSAYEIESRLATGGMAEVWRAKIAGFEKRIVIKTMLPQYQARPDVVAMFVNEASLAARLSHPNIVDVIDFGQLEGRYFIAMEYVPGLTLRFALRRMAARDERLPVAAVLHLMRDVCEALEHMHELEDAEGAMGLLHRDLSPDNILISTSGSAKLIDFGAARASKRSPAPRVFVGKFRYAAPERIHLTSEDGRSDIYSVGVVLHECLTGVRPFTGSDSEVIEAVSSSEGCDPSDIVPSLPPSVVALVRKATAPRPGDRFETARDLGIALARCLAELGSAGKEREVTSALTRALDEPGEPLSVSIVDDDALTDVVEADSAIPVLSEREILEASGPINLGGIVSAAGPQPDTQRIELPIPPEAFRPDDAVEHFDRGMRLRLAGRYAEALAAWEHALTLAPSNLLYQSHVHRLRSQLNILPRAER
jgi:serine/threonine protein kinase